MKKTEPEFQSPVLNEISLDTFISNDPTLKMFLNEKNIDVWNDWHWTVYKAALRIAMAKYVAYLIRSVQ